MSTSVLKFIDRTPETQLRKRKRKQNRHACDECRKRKVGQKGPDTKSRPVLRRCPHDYTGASFEWLPPAVLRSETRRARAGVTDSPSPLSNSAASSPQPVIPTGPTVQPHAQESPVQHNAAVEQAPSLSEVSPAPANIRRWTSRSSSPVSTSDNVGLASSYTSSDPGSDDRPTFVGHLNPEGIFLATTRLGAVRASRCDDTLGFWLPKEHDRRQRPEVGQQLPSHQPVSSPRRRSGVPRTLVPQQVLQGKKALPDPRSFNALRAIYFKDVHPLFPILRPELIPEMTATDDLSPTETILMQSLCLAVATNAAAEPFLCLENTKGTLKPMDFASCLSQALVTSINTANTTDLLLSVRVLTILSLFSQLSTDDHTSAEYCARAISCMHTLQLHLDTTRVRTDDAMVTQVFLCVWALDRLNAAFHSRPSMVHPRDIGRNMQVSIAQQEGCFRAFLMVCGLIDEVTNLYRPTHELGASAENSAFPSFEDLVIEADAIRCPTHLLATIETLYHSAAMLSYRFHSLENPDRSSISYLRSNLSAARLISIMENRCASSLSNFPFVPYSISLALRVSYRELRFSKIPLHRSMARSRLLNVCTILEKFSDKYAFTRRLTALAATTVRELDKVVTSVLQARHNETENIEITETAEVEDRDQNAHVPEVNNNATIIPPESNPINVTSEKIDHPGNSQVPQHNLAEYNADSFDMVYNIPDLPNLFEHFDLEFNLDAVDFTLMQDVRAGTFQNYGLNPDIDWIPDLEIQNTFPGNAES
ncbi:hypothetical protein F5884DRAFT_440209 [Xylogone sp. PMI_703]|nr:hypothetical protein F5884DRAFT_440209 [Xylogone sp. PMI_703]